MSRGTESTNKPSMAGYQNMRTFSNISLLVDYMDAGKQFSS